MGDVSRQNIAGRHGEFNNALFFWSRISTRKNEAFVFLRSKVKGKRARLIVGLMALVLTGCDGVKNGNIASSQPAQVPMRVVTDDLGRKVTVPVTITRVVSTAPSITEMIFAASGGDRLVGVTTFCNYPEAAKSIAKVGDTMNPNMETIVGLKPDVVFVTTASQIEAFTKTLESNGIAVYVTNTKSLYQVLDDLRHLGDMFDKREQTDLLVTKLEDRIRDVRCNPLHRCGAVVTNSNYPIPANHADSGRPIKVFVQISNEPLFTIGKDAFLNEVIEIAFGESVTRDVETVFPKLSKETASMLDPEVIILSESDDNLNPNDAFKNSSAVRTGRIYKINADLISRPGPRLVDALEEIAKDLHPQNFTYR